MSGGVAAWPGDPLADRGRVAGGGDGRSPQRTGERITDRTTQSEASFPGADRQPEPVGQAGEAIRKSRESRPAAERSRVSTTDLAGTTKPPNSLPPRPAGADPAVTFGGLPPQGGAEAASAANPTARRAPEQVLGLGLRAAAQVGSPAPARTLERMTSASRPAGCLASWLRHRLPRPHQRSRVAESVASRSARREQPGVLGQQAPVVDRSGGAGSSLGSPVVDRERGAGSMPAAVVPDSGTVSAESLVAQPQRSPARPTVAESVASRSARASSRVCLVSRLRLLIVRVVLVRRWVRRWWIGSEVRDRCRVRWCLIPALCPQRALWLGCRAVDPKQVAPSDRRHRLLHRPLNPARQ